MSFEPGQAEGQHRRRRLERGVKEQRARGKGDDGGGERCGRVDEPMAGPTARERRSHRADR